MEPHIYAAAYHALYYLIKQADPTARVIAGTIVQPTPLRLRYLDMVLDQLPSDIRRGHARRWLEHPQFHPQRGQLPLF